MRLRNAGGVTRWGRNRTKGRPRLGAAAVELAVVLVPLLILLFGTIEVNRAIMVQQTLEEAARAGCRVRCITLEATEEDVHAVIDQTMAAAGITGYTVEISPDFDEDADGNGEVDEIAYLQPMTVRVSVPYGQVDWLNTNWVLDDDTRPLIGTCVMPADTSEIFNDEWVPPVDVTVPPDDPPVVEDPPPADDPPPATGGDDDDDDDDRGRHSRYRDRRRSGRWGLWWW